MTPSEGWWVLKAQAGDGEALDRLLREIYPPLLRFVTRMVGDRSAAVQDGDHPVCPRRGRHHCFCSAGEAAAMTMNAVEATLKHVESNERNQRIAILAGAVLEAVFLGAFLLVADFSNRTHVLLLMVFAASLSLLVIAAMALAAYVNRHTLRVLTAVEMLRGELATSTSAPSR